ncbi:MAG: mechanosensitive ion channel domain-containing protein [Pseudomonadota bacterium]
MDMGDFNDFLAAVLTMIRTTMRTEFTSIWLPIQLGIILLVVLAAIGAAALIRKRFDLVSATMGWPAYLKRVVHAVSANFSTAIFIVLIAITRAGIDAAVDRPRIYLLTIALNLATAWLVIAIVTSVIRNQFVNRVVAVTAWTIAALSILKLLNPVVNSLDSISLTLGGLRLTPLLIMKTGVLLVLALWGATTLSNFLDKRIHGFQDLTPSVQELLVKLIRIALITLAIIIVLNSMGIDLSVLALFSGAVGVGLGFGLQKIVSNLVSGIILLADKSVKPGDVISVGEHFGRVEHMGARYTLVDTRDGREYLIPNEDFVTQRVVNWSYSSDLVRLEVKFGTTYASDPHKTQKVAIEAAQSVERVVKTPAPICHLLAFGQSSLEFNLTFWIHDPVAGVSKVRSDVLLALWDTLDKEGIGIPKPGPTRMIIERAT